MASYAALFLVTGLLVYLSIFIAVSLVINYGAYRMAKHAGIPHPWLALLPLGNAYVTGLLAERSVYTYTGRQRRLAFWYPVCQLVTLVGLLAILGLALADADFNLLVAASLVLGLAGFVAQLVIGIYCYYYIFKDYAPDNATLYTVLGIVFGIYWIFLFVEMNSVPVSVTGFGAWPYGRPKYDRYHQWQQGGQQPQYSAPAPQGPNTTGWEQGAPSYQQPQAPYQQYPPPQGQQSQPPRYVPGQTPYQGQGPQFYQGQPQGYYKPERPASSEQEENQGPELK